MSDATMYPNSEHLSLLLQWCQVLCAGYDVEVTNFSASFSDGCALLLLIHHYMPQSVQLSEVRMETAQAILRPVNAENADDVAATEQGWAGAFSPGINAYGGRRHQVSPARGTGHSGNAKS